MWGWISAVFFTIYLKFKKNKIKKNLDLISRYSYTISELYYHVCYCVLFDNYNILYQCEIKYSIQWGVFEWGVRRGEWKDSVSQF